ncbi:metalloregulator ArsR/SmtB family transcription factor [Actinoplanes sp. NPDC026619]|uniref:ArsR/SmtB family transcription factor n=1 Tax=Actinoplanes sp. NPDC026619 TaxID=3155798 RepID=UPI0033D82F64
MYAPGRSWEAGPAESVVAAAAVALALLGDVTRLRLAVRLLDGEQDVTTLTEAVGAARPAVSQHLAKLRLAGLVATRRDGRRVLYTLADQHVRKLVAEAIFTAEHRVLDRPDHHAVAP